MEIKVRREKSKFNLESKTNELVNIKVKIFLITHSDISI
jgi:hypothetical protein